MQALFSSFIFDLRTAIPSSLGLYFIAIASYKFRHCVCIFSLTVFLTENTKKMLEVLQIKINRNLFRDIKNFK